MRNVIGIILNKIWGALVSVFKTAKRQEAERIVTQFQEVQHFLNRIVKSTAIERAWIVRAESARYGTKLNPLQEIMYSIVTETVDPKSKLEYAYWDRRRADRFFVILVLKLLTQKKARAEVRLLPQCDLKQSYESDGVTRVLYFSLYTDPKQRFLIYLECHFRNGGVLSVDDILTLKGLTSKLAVRVKALSSHFD